MNITINRAVVEQALEALEYVNQYTLPREIVPAAAALRAALAEDGTCTWQKDTCTWQQDGDCDSSMYSTSCRRYFDLNDGAPEDNNMKWCCYCGKPLVQKLITEAEDE